MKLLTSLSITALLITSIPLFAQDVEARGFGGRAFFRPSISRSAPRSAPTRAHSRVETKQVVRESPSDSMTNNVVSGVAGAVAGAVVYDAMTSDKEEQSKQQDYLTK